MILINRTTFPNQILILKLQNTKTNKKKQKYFRYERKYMYVIRHISPIICTFGHFGANIGLWRLIWWPVGCGAWLLLRQSFYLFYLCMQWMGKIMHCFLKNNTATQLFVPIVLKKSPLVSMSSLSVSYGMMLYWVHGEHESSNTGIIRFSNDNHLLYLLMGTTVCKRKFWSLTHTYIYQRSHHVTPSNAWSPRTLLTFSCWEKWRSHTKFRQNFSSCQGS